MDDRDGLAAYRLLEFPNESAQSWPITVARRDERPIPYLRFLRDWRRNSNAAKRIVA